jgi:hypothetical protein
MLEIQKEKKNEMEAKQKRFSMNTDEGKTIFFLFVHIKSLKEIVKKKGKKN